MCIYIYICLYVYKQINTYIYIYIYIYVIYRVRAASLRRLCATAAARDISGRGAGGNGA